MAVMVDANRQEVWKEFMRLLSQDHSACPNVLKNDIKAAVDAVDQWVSDNAVSYNNALPVAFRNNATTAQKVRLLFRVIARRYDLGL